MRLDTEVSSWPSLKIWNTLNIRNHGKVSLCTKSINVDCAITADWIVFNFFFSFVFSASSFEYTFFGTLDGYL